MKLRDYMLKVAPRSLYYEATRRRWVKPINPLTLTFSVTAACQSKCRTCNIGQVYLDNPQLAKRNLSLGEVEQVFKKLGPVYFFNVSGGEPFMRPELSEIVRLACIHLKPRLVHIPTNGIGVKHIEKETRKILEREELPVNPTTARVPVFYGHSEAVHIETREKLKPLAEERGIGWRDYWLGTVISNHNLHHLDDIEDWVHERGIESYRHEIAEQRAEFHNLGDPITPSAEVYGELIERFKKKILRNVKKKAPLTRVTEAVRLVYYDVALQILRERRQVTPCYGGISNIHMNYDGEIWPCCVLGGTQSLGQVREWDYDIPALLDSRLARESKKYIAEGNCACPLANQWLNNVLLTPRHMLKVLYTYLVKFHLPMGRTLEPEPARERRKVNPSLVKVTVVGDKPRKALVMHKFGTIPLEEEVEVPEVTS